MNLAELGLAFRTARIERRLTQQDLVSMTGISVTLISKLEGGMLPDVGIVRLIALLECVGLELQARSRIHRRTLDDIAEELNAEALKDPRAVPIERQRVRRTRAEKAPKTSH
ncbi:helix-turn-helix domain-containing protein [Dechloromonas hortensis]|uniref:helix-turn-helix domain-containing protein n=1 Tax=Dechloromonas hortensis TaxID=337779 RepID=UPI001290FBCB|nr:helix-turn-helix domain-containing protein [Dechloromonas hortensis]